MEIDEENKKFDLKSNIEKHLFVFWLVVPLIALWLTVSYAVGFIKDRPIWYKNVSNIGVSSPQAPYIQGYSPISKSSTGYLTLWFDDAWLSQYLLAYPILKTYGFKAALAVPTGVIETPNYMNWAQLRVLQDAGWEITNHSVKHDCTMQNWSSDEIARELKNSKLMLWKNKLTSDIFVTPCGVDSKALREEAEKLFIGYRTVDPGFNTLENLDLNRLKVKNIDNDVSLEDVKGWINQAKETKTWLILVFHKVGEQSNVEGDDLFNTKESDFRQILEHIKNLQVEVVVPSQIASLL